MPSPFSGPAWTCNDSEHAKSPARQAGAHRSVLQFAGNGMLFGSCHFLFCQFTQRDKPCQIITDMDAPAAFSAASVRSPDFEPMDSYTRDTRPYLRSGCRCFVHTGGNGVSACVLKRRQNDPAEEWRDSQSGTDAAVAAETIIVHGKPEQANVSG